MKALRIVGIAGNITRPSRTRALIDAILSEAALRGLGETEAFDVVDAGPELGMAVSRETAAPHLDRILSAIERSDVLVAATPVYKASYTGLFKHLFDLLDRKVLEGRPVLLAATGGSDRHALVIEHQLRPLFGFFGASSLAISLYAVNSDFLGSGELAPAMKARIDRAVDEIAALSSPVRRVGRPSVVASVA
jgi:FMN reductase